MFFMYPLKASEYRSCGMRSYLGFPEVKNLTQLYSLCSVALTYALSYLKFQFEQYHILIVLGIYIVICLS